MVPWNEAIRKCVKNFQFKESLLIFCEMRHLGLNVDPLALAAVSKSCAMISDVGLGESVHGFVTRSGYCSITCVEKALLDMYARFNKLHQSVQIFKEMALKDSVSWNILMSGYTRLGYQREAMDHFYLMHVCDKVMPNAISIAIILPACIKMGSWVTAKSIHVYAIKTGLLSDTLVGNSLVSMYAKCGSSIGCAHIVFNLIWFKDVVSWNSIIAAYAENGFIEEALSLFWQMVSGGFLPNGSTITIVLPLISYDYRVYHWGKVIHCRILRFHFETDTFVSNALMTYYARIGDMKCVEHVFDHMHAKDVVSWNTIIAGCSLNRMHSTVLKLFSEMILVGMIPDSVTVVNVLPICARLHDVYSGREIHAYISKDTVLSKDISVCNALISFYGKCKDLESALKTFVVIPQKDLVSWNAMLSAFADNDEWNDVLGFLKHMLVHQIRADYVSISIVLQACSRLSFRVVRELHGYSIRAGHVDIVSIGNAFIDAYANSGSIDYAYTVFDCLPEHNIVSFNILLSALTTNGFHKEAEDLFNKMEQRDIDTFNVMLQLHTKNYCFDEALQFFSGLQRHGMMPDPVSIMAILPVCSFLASVYLVKQCHSYALRNHFDDLYLHSAFLDAYSKSGSINYAWKLFRTNGQSDVVSFTAMIGGFARFGMAKEALVLLFRMLEKNIKPDHVIMISLLFACSHAGLLNEGWKLFRSMEIVHGIRLTIEHYACIIDLFARSGQFNEAYALLASMPYETTADMWGTLLGACKTHGEVEIAQLAAKQLFKMGSENIGNYVVMSNVFALDGRWTDVENVRELMKAKYLKKSAGCSWIEVEKMRHIFIAGDLVHPEKKFIHFILNNLNNAIMEPSL